MLIMWIGFIFSEEVRRKINFVVQVRQIKEYQKLLGLTHIMMPHTVRNMSEA